jgi:hypothetical protein
MGREINTMGSKSNHAQMQKLVVQNERRIRKDKGTSLKCVVASSAFGGNK